MSKTTHKAKSVDLRDLFHDLQEEMSVALKTKRKHIPHPGEKGTSAEARWATWLTAYLPTRYQVKHSAFIVDSAGTISQQQDVVIFDRQYTPFLLNQDGTTYIPAEGVYAVFEAKQDLTGPLVKYAGEKVRSVRRLHRTSAQIAHAAGTVTKPKAPPRILGGLLALDSSWSKSSWRKQLAGSLNRLPEADRLDLVCALTRGSAAVRCEGKNAELITSEDGLSFFFLSLLDRLQSMGTVPGIVFGKYLASIPTHSTKL